MLTPIEKILFALVVTLSLSLTWRGVRHIMTMIGSGQGKPDWRLARKRLWRVMGQMVIFRPVFRFRPITSLFHAFVGWGFGFYVLVNLVDVTKGYLPGFQIPGIVGNIFRLLADLLSAGVLIGMAYFVIRRFVFQPSTLSSRATTLLHPKAQTGIRRDSAIVAAFIILHIGARLIGESFMIARIKPDAWQPFASTMANLWSGWNTSILIIGEHIAFWLALGLILVFLPYFPYSKHIHLFFAPLNFLLKPERKSIGELNHVDTRDTSIEQFGAAKLADLGWEQIMDAYACVMCNRCQEVCPAYNTGKALSPATLEINKRYMLNSLQSGPISAQPLTGFAISEDAIWACTSCGACVDVCPVGNEPMRDILDMRRNLVLMENKFPKPLENAFRGMERNANPWNISRAERLKWASGLNVPTIEQNPQPEILWWVGCAPATDARAQKTASAFVKILNAAAVDFAVLGQKESCTGDSARRAGREDIFFELASANVKLLNQISPKRIVTTCPHCLHTIKNEYPAFGGNYEVIHHTQLINELVGSGRLVLHPQSETGSQETNITFHDPCYLGRHNQIYVAPRTALKNSGSKMIEMPNHDAKSFCCGAGGAQMWKEEERGDTNVNLARFREAKATGANMLAVGCPFCLTMLNDASQADGGLMSVKDVAEIIAEQL